MLNTLDTVIAFAVIMTVLSLLITILVQMVSTALSLRGKNLANALALTFQTIDPKIGEDAHSLAAQILRDPIFSDSILRSKNRPPVIPSGKAQAIIDVEREVKTAEAQLAIDPENAEKKNTLEAAKKKLAVEKSTVISADEKVEKARQELAAEPKNPDKQKALKTAEAELARAKTDLEIPPVTPNREEPWGVFSKLVDATALGSAIRPGEVYRLLYEIADFTETEAAVHNIPSELVKKSVHLLACLNVQDQPAKESKEKLEEIRNIAAIFTTPLQQKAVLDSLANFGATVERATTEAYDRFQRWFGSAQDRAEQWFQTHVRIVTIICSIFAALILQLDTAEIFRQLRDQPKLVEALVKAAPSVVEKGGEILAPSDTPAYHAYLLWLREHPLFSLADLPVPADQAHYTQALQERLAEPPNPEFPLSKFAEDYKKASEVEGAAKPSPGAIAKAAYESWLEKFPTYNLPADYEFKNATKESVTKDIADLVAKDPDHKADRKALLEQYANLQTQGAYAYEQSRKKAFADLQKKLDQAGFDLLPRRFLGRWDKDQTPSWARAVCLPRPAALFLTHLLGILATAGLLSLGAPFWFNLLKNLTSLRPALATLIEKRPTSAPALPAAPSTPPSPS
jgi:hypothetical protein